MVSTLWAKENFIQYCRLCICTRQLSSYLLHRSRLIDGTDVLQEVYCKSRQGGIHEDLPRRGPDNPPVGHHECINDIAVTKLPQNYIISAGRDGVLKIWK